MEWIKKSIGPDNHQLRNIRIALAAAASLGLILGMARRQPPVQFDTWMVYWDKGNDETLLRLNGKKFNSICFFSAVFDPLLNMAPASPWVKDTIEMEKQAHLPMSPSYMVTAVNDMVTPGETRLKDPGTVDTILNSPEKTKKHLQDLMKLADLGDGVEIDYENLWLKDRDNFSNFMAELAKRLHEKNKQLAVVVQAQTKTELKDGPGALDWAELGKNVDRVKIMAYYYHYAKGAAGPLAPPDWVGDVARFALTQIPPEKVCVAISLRGFDWKAGENGKQIGYQEAMRLAQLHQAEIKRDEATASPTFTYEDQGAKHEVWFEDSISVTKKIETLQSMGIRHIAIWWLGADGKAIWDQLPVRTS